MKVYIVTCDIGSWGHDSTMAVCDSKETAEKWLEANMQRLLDLYKDVPVTDEDSFDIDELDFITANEVK